MGYVHNTHMSQRTALQMITATVGTWAMAASAHIWTLDKTAAADTSILHIPVTPLQNSQESAGSKLASIDIQYVVATANLSAMAAKVYKTTMAAEGDAPASAEIPSTSTFFLTQDDHKVTISITTPVFIAEDEDVFVELTVNAAATSVIKLQGVSSNYTLRI